MTTDLADAMMTVEFVGPMPEGSEEAAAHMAKWVTLIRGFDQTLVHLSNEQIMYALEQI